MGGRFRLVGPEPAGWFTVIGVSPNLCQDDLSDDSPPFPSAYVPHPYGATANTGGVVRAADPGLAIFNVRTMEELRAMGFWQFRLFGFMFAIFGAAALFLAGIGIYGVLSFSVSQRAQEMGVRIALGAQHGDALRPVVCQGITLAMLGVVLGLAGAFGVTRVISSLLYNVTPTDPISFGGVALFLTAIAFIASYLPARRATAVGPIVVLRND